MSERDTILGFCIPHVCDADPHSPTRSCGREHPPGCLEFPSLVFVDAAARTRAANPSEPLPPD
jgi:hypothetical protein